MPTRVSDPFLFIAPQDPVVIEPDTRIILPGDGGGRSGVIVPTPPAKGKPRIPPAWVRPKGQKPGQISPDAPDPFPDGPKKSSKDITRLKQYVPDIMNFTNVIELVQGDNPYPIVDWAALEHYWPDTIPSTGLSHIWLADGTNINTATKYPVTGLRFIPIEHMMTTAYLRAKLITHFASNPEYHFIENILMCVLVIDSITEEQYETLDGDTMYVITE